jgi:hypothetical protein
VLSRGTKQFFLQFANTAILVLIINAQVNSKWAFLRSGDFSDFSVQWYLSVGVSITLTMLAYIFTPHIGVVGALLIKSLQYVSPPAHTHHVISIQLTSCHHTSRSSVAMSAPSSAQSLSSSCVTYHTSGTQL